MSIAISISNSVRGSLVPGGGVTPFVNQYSMTFDGVDEYFNGGSTFSELDGGTKLSLSIWIKPISGSPFLEYIISNPRDTTANNSQFALTLFEGAGISFNVQTRTNQYVNGNIGAITYGAWNHILVCVDLDRTTGTEGAIFINGVDETTTSAMGTLTQFYNASGVLYVGEEANGGYNPFNGSIDELAIWVNSDQRANVSDIYNGGVPFDLSTLATAPSHWWRMGDNDTWNGSSWILSDNIGSYDLTSANIEEADRLPISPNSYSLNSFAFDGVDEYMNMAFTNTSTTGTISVWVKPTNYTTGSQSMCIYTSGGYRDYIMLHSQNTGGIRAVSAENGVTQWDIRTNTGHLTNGVWTHICFVFNGTSGTFYINGNSVPATYFNTTNTSYWWDDLLPTQQKLGVFEVNGYTTSLRYNGSIDEVAIWDNDQSANISTIFNNGVPQDISSLSPISNLRMGESATWNGSTWTLTDQGSGGNDATSVNMEEADKTGDQAYVI